MAIALSCSCGRSFRIKDELAGSKVKCPDCGSILAVPKPQPQEDEEDDAFVVLSEEVSPGEQKERRRAWETPTAPEPPNGRQLSKPGSALSPKRPRSKEDSPRERGPRIAFEPGWFGSINSGVIGGILMMVIAAVWFFVGMAADRIFIYPPILFCIGVISMVKGFTGGGD